MNKLIPALALTALLLTGCGEKAPAPTITPATEPPVTETRAAETTVPEITVPETTEPTLPDPTEETVALSYAAYQVTYTYLEDNGQEFYTFQGLDPQGNIAWSLETAHLDLAQIPRIMPIGTFEDRFLYNEGGTVIALDLVTGRELWRNGDFGGSFAAESAAVIDPLGYLYLCGGDTPDLFVCDMEGNTILRIGAFENRQGTPYAIRQEGSELVVTSESGGETAETRVPMDWIPQPEG